MEFSIWINTEFNPFYLSYWRTSEDNGLVFLEKARQVSNDIPKGNLIAGHRLP